MTSRVTPTGFSEVVSEIDGLLKTRMLTMWRAKEEARYIALCATESAYLAQS